MRASEGEVRGLLQGLNWIVSLEYNHVIFELDCKMVIDDVHSEKLNHLKYGSVLQDCKILLENYNNYQVVFTTSSKR